MKKLLLKSMLLLCALIVGSSSVWATDPVTLVSGSGSSGYAIPTGWTSSGTVEGGSYLKLDNGTITSPTFAAHNSLSFTYTVATFGSGTNHPLTIRILNASTDAVIVEKTTATPTSSSYISTDSPISLGDISVPFKIQMYAPTGKGIRLRNYSVTGIPASSDPAISVSGNSLSFGEVEASGSKAMTFSVTPANLTAGLTLSVNNDKYTVSPTSISKDATGAQTITVTANPTTVNDNMDGKITISGDDFTDDTEVTLSATVVRKSPALAYDPTSVTITKGESFTAPAFSKDAGINFSSITFSSSYNDVATVSNEGVIALGTSTGTAIIKATFAQTDVYAAGEATCKIIVNPVGVTPEPSATGYYVKVTAVDDLADGDYLIVYEDEQVALDGNLTSDKVDGASNTVEYEYDASDNIEVSSDTEAAEFEIKAITGGYSIKSKANSYYLTHTGNNNTLNTSEDAVANAITFSNAGNAIIKIGDYNIRYNSASGQKRFRYYTSAANVHLYKKVAGAAPSDIDIYVSEAGYATYASNFDLDFSTNGNLKAYIAKEVSSEIKMVEVEKVAAGTGVLLHATDGGGKAYTVETTTETTADVTGNLFKRGNDEAVAYEAGEGKYNYILNVVNNQLGFYKAAGKTVAKNRAYLQTSIAASRIDMNFDEEVTGIKLVETSKSNNEGYYNLAGQRVAQPTNGLYIVNGRKVIIK